MDALVSMVWYSIISFWNLLHLMAVIVSLTTASNRRYHYGYACGIASGSDNIDVTISLYTVVRMPRFLSKPMAMPCTFVTADVALPPCGHVIAVYLRGRLRQFGESVGNGSLSRQYVATN